jgi:hypothetical protein
MADANYTSNQSLNLMTKESEIIGYFARGQKQTISSPNLKLEYTDTSIRLSDNHAMLIGISKQVNKWQRKVLISNNYAYKSSIVKTLKEIGFITRKKSSHPEFTEYHYYDVPDGYNLNYTEVIQLWRTWWHNKRHQINVANAPIDLSIFSKGNWYLVQDLQPTQGSFSILTAKGKIVIEPEEYIVWIDRSVATVEIELPLQNVDNLAQADYIDRLPESEEYIDLEAYLSTFNTEDSEDVDRIEGIYNINELLSDNNIGADLSASAQIGSEPLANSQPLVSTPISTQSAISVAQRQASLKLKAMNVLATYVQEGELTVHIEVLKNAQGQEISRKVTKTQRGCPQWAIEQINKLTSCNNA